MAAGLGDLVAQVAREETKALRQTAEQVVADREAAQQVQTPQSLVVSSAPALAVTTTLIRLDRVEWRPANQARVVVLPAQPPTSDTALAAEALALMGGAETILAVMAETARSGKARLEVEGEEEVALPVRVLVGPAVFLAEEEEGAPSTEALGVAERRA